MKRFCALLLVLCCLLGVSAYADGKLKVTDKTLIVYDGDDTGYFFARVENIGDASVGVGSGNLVTFDDEDEMIFTDGYVSVCPSGVILEPGEFVFVREFLWESELEEREVADYKFSAEKRSYGDAMTILPAEITYELEGAGTYNNYLYVTIRNETDEMLEAPYVVGVLYDTEGNLAYVGTESMSAIQIHPHSSVTVAMYIDNEMMIYYSRHDVKVAEAAAFVYIQK